MPCSEIVLATLNCRWSHPAFGLRWLLANLGELEERTTLLEFDLERQPLEVLDEILRHEPRIVGLGVYLWNVERLTAVAAMLKRLRPEVVLVVGGPEVSHEPADQEICQLADHVVVGEGEQAFAELCRRRLAGEAPGSRLLEAPPPDLAQLTPPYGLYSAEDLAHRVVYVEASRGCPFGCEFCLSALADGVRPFPLAPFLGQMEQLLARGARRFKFVDRTFNLERSRTRAILEFFLEHLVDDLHLHFEVVPERFPAELIGLLARFPAGSMQLEIGIQSLDPEVAARIGRRIDAVRIAETLQRLRAETKVHLHADLIAGLPGEGIDGFGASFDRLVELAPHEIQIELLKRLRGAPLASRAAELGLIFNPAPPYEILSTPELSFAELQRIRRLAATWERMASARGFPRTLPQLWSGAERSPFRAFLRWSEWLFARTARTHSIGLVELLEHFLAYLTGELGYEPSAVTPSLWEDYRQDGRRSDRPRCLPNRTPKSGSI